MTRAVLSPQARRDLLDAAAWIAQDDPGAARALRDAVAEALERLGRFPRSGVERPDLASPPIRFLVMTQFPYVLVYDPDAEAPRVLRLLHGSRDLPRLLQPWRR